jgi:hypothetical protein
VRRAGGEHAGYEPTAAEAADVTLPTLTEFTDILAAMSGSR